MSDLGDFWRKLRKLYQQQPSIRQPSTPSLPQQKPTVTQPVQQPQTGPLSDADKQNIIQTAGRQRMMLEIKYDGVSRLVEPYSFRTSRTGQLLFYGFCSIHSKIHSFKLDKIQDIRISEFPFSPRWPVEL